MIDEAPQHVQQSQFARLSVHDGQHDHAEIHLELGVLVEIVQNDFGLLAALQLEDDAHAVAIAFVANFRNAFDLLLVHQSSGGFDQPRFVHLVRNLGDDDRFAVLAHRLGGGLGAQFESAATLGEVIDDPLPAEDESAGREIGTLHHVRNFRQRRVGLLHQRNGRVDDLGEIVRRDIGRHADRDARRSVDQQIRNARRKHFGLHAALVEVGPEIDRLFVEILQQRGVDAREPRFGVPVGRRRIAIHRSEIALPIHQRIPQRKILRHADQGVVDRLIAVRMIVAQHFANDAGALAISAVERQAHLRHRVQNPAMHRLQTVANVGQRAPDDHAHRVVEIRPPHLVFDVDRDYILLAAIAPQGHLRARAGRRRRDSRVVRTCQELTP